MGGKKSLWVHVLVLLGVAFVAAHSAHAQSAAPAPDRRAELINMVRQDCGSCHGLTFKGGLGPALLPDALAGKPAEALVSTVLYGRAGTAMPGWARFMNAQEAAWIVAQLMEGFPQRADSTERSQ
ncbi:MAG: cytochrome c [Rhodocyclaceae bacterium]|nr:cytochrome c [Rhodocyclaceae bacterium]